jgi:23S rRNA pseudouridine1911/1915/1917 synthase
VGEGGLRGGVVHRLDVETSGVLLVATEDAAWGRLRRAFAAHRVGKTYHAVVCGRPPEEGAVALDLKVARHRPARVAAWAAGEGPPSARRCATAWTVLEAGKEAALLEVRPVSGFLHQIRVTLGHLGHPVVGDALYGEPGRAPAVAAAAGERLLLHAAALTFAEISVHSPWPNPFRAAVAALGA